MISRREWLQRVAGAGGLLALDPLLAGPATLITRAIPSTQERLPIVGLGSSATFSPVARGEDVSALRAVLETMVERGGAVFEGIAVLVYAPFGRTRLWQRVRGRTAPCPRSARTWAICSRRGPRVGGAIARRAPRVRLQRHRRGAEEIRRIAATLN